MKKVPTERVTGGSSIFTEEKAELCKKSQGIQCGFARVVFCNNETDIIECSRCGKQRTTTCNFDEDYA